MNEEKLFTNEQNALAYCVRNVELTPKEILEVIVNERPDVLEYFQGQFANFYIKQAADLIHDLTSEIKEDLPHDEKD